LLPISPTRRKLLPLLALPVLLVAGIGVTGNRSATPASSPPGAPEVTITGFAFKAPALEVGVGTTVTWTNQDTAAHSIRDAVDTFPESADLAQGEVFEATYDTPGEYSYFCGIHQYMKGTVTVT
jgi:plastocyanin